MAGLEKRETFLAPHDWFSRWFEDWPVPPRWPDLWRTRLLEEVEPMRVEEFAEDKTLVVRAEMPGLDPDKDVEIDVSDQTLHIRAERRQETKVEEGAVPQRVPLRKLHSNRSSPGRRHREGCQGHLQGRHPRSPHPGRRGTGGRAEDPDRALVKLALDPYRGGQP